jgi:serine/threonine protein kinase
MEMLYGQLPFKSSSGPERDYSQSILSLQYTLPKNKNVSENARNLIESLLVKQANRLTLAQVEKHPWMQM